MRTLSNIPPERAHAVVVVVVVVVVDIAGRRDAKKNTIYSLIYFSYLLLHAIDINFTSETFFDQNSADFLLMNDKFIESSI